MISIDLTNNLAAFYLAKHKKSSAIYILVLLVFMLGIASLSFITIDITFQSRGQIRPVSERIAIVTSLPAQIKEVLPTKNKQAFY